MQTERESFYQKSAYPEILELPVEIVINPSNRSSSPSIKIEESQGVELPDSQTIKPQNVDSHYPHTESNLV